jgi:GT2 family glycosyltransferase
MSEDARVDVIILSWNRVEDTLAALESARDQRGVEQRIWVVDQGSESEQRARLAAAVAGVPIAHLTQLETNIGVPAGRNLAAALGTAPYIVALDSDAVFADEHVLARAVHRMNEERDLCAAGFAIINYFTRENDWSSWDYPTHNSPELEFYTTRFVGAGHIIRRSTFAAVGGYDARLMFSGEELDLSYRMLNTGQRVKYVPSLAVLHKVARERRVFWERGRFYLSVRNTLYTLYKFNTPPLRVLVALAAFCVRGLRNHLIRDAIRGAIACIPMCLAFARSSGNKAAYDLSPETWHYIRQCEPTRNDPWHIKFQRLLVLLPTESRAPQRPAL